jgi:hypothetical protein
MPPGKSVIPGKEATRKNYVELFTFDRLWLTTQIEEIDSSENLDVVAGHNFGQAISFVRVSPESSKVSI